MDPPEVVVFERVAIDALESALEIVAQGESGVSACGFEVDLAVWMDAERGVREVHPHRVNVPTFVKEEFGTMGDRQRQRSTDDLPTRKDIEALELGMEAVWDAEDAEEENKPQGVCFG